MSKNMACNLIYDGLWHQSYNMLKVLETGGLGFIGGHIDYLIDNGYDVTILDNMSSKLKGDISQIHANVDKLFSLGFKPNSDLKTGIRMGLC
jgi:UDP-glucose 4-epimerase